MPIISAISLILNIYIIIIFVRIILTWFSWERNGGITEILARITDPYLNWFRRFTFLRIGFLDLSPIAALGVLTLVDRILRIAAATGKITIGIILGMLLQMIWGALSFLLGFIIIILVLRLIAGLVRVNKNNSFWQIIEAISQPVLYRISRLLFGNRIMNYISAMIISIAAMLIVYIGLRFLVFFLFRMLLSLPV
jgi:YggT family protein